MKERLKSLDSPTRREFVEGIAKSAFGVSMLPLTDTLLAQNATTVGKPASKISGSEGGILSTATRLADQLPERQWVSHANLRFCSSHLPCERRKKVRFF
jgi:hypothetical protein